MGIPEPETLFLDLSDAAWRALTDAHPKAQIFHHPAWTRLLADCYGYRPFVVAVRDADGTICAGLPMMEVGGRLTGRRWISLPFSDHCAPLCRSVESLNRLSDSLVNLSRDQNTPKIELRCELPPQPGIRTFSHHVLHTLPLCPDSDTVFDCISPMHRRNIRIAEKRGVRIKWGTQRNHLQDFYRLHLETRQRKGVPIQPWRFFDILGSSLLEKGLGFVMLAYKDDACLAGAVFLHWHDTLTYKFGASHLEGLNLRPNNLLMWAAICWGCRNGFDRFDMGRTDNDDAGLRAFKSGWGAEEMPLAYSNLSSVPVRSATGRLAPIMQTVIRNSPPWVCRATGELLYKHFGV